MAGQLDVAITMADEKDMLIALMSIRGVLARRQIISPDHLATYHRAPSFARMQ